MKLPLQEMSSVFTVKQFHEDDIPAIYKVCKGNPAYYEYMKMEPDFENLREVLTELPPGKTPEDKYFAGFYNDRCLIAVLDLISGYPTPETAFIGWFMMAKEAQGVGTGSKIITDVLHFLKKNGFQQVCLGVIKGNKEAENFWRKNRFLPTGEESAADQIVISLMQRKL